MYTIRSQKPNVCRICGCYFTIIDKYCGVRCLNPGHWQAAGLLTPTDFYPMALIAAQFHGEQNFRARQNHHRH